MRTGNCPSRSPWAMPSMRDRWKRQSAPLGAAAVHQRRHADQDRHARQQPQAAPHAGVRQRRRASRQKPQQRQIRQQEQRQPAEHTGPGKRLVLADGHVPDGKDAAVVVGHQAHGVAGVVHVQHNGVLLGIPVYPTVFAADGHLLPRRKIDAGMVFHAVRVHARPVTVLQLHAVVPRRQRHGRGLQDRFALAHLRHAAAALLIVGDRGLLRDDFPLVRRVRILDHRAQRRRQR